MWPAGLLCRSNEPANLLYGAWLYLRVGPPVAYTTDMDWRYLLFLILTLLITAVVGYGTFMTARLLRHWQPQENALLLPAENILRATVLVICFFLGRGSGLPPAALGWQLPNAGAQLLIGVLTGLGLAALFVGIGRFVIRYTNSDFYRPILALVIPRNRREARLLPFALLLSVVFEEALFRGLLIGGLSPLLPTAWLIIGFGVVFGLLHSPQGAWGMIGAGAAGALFGWLFVWQQSLLTPIVTHFVANGAQIWLASKQNISG